MDYERARNLASQYASLRRAAQGASIAGADYASAALADAADEVWTVIESECAEYAHEKLGWPI